MFRIGVQNWCLEQILFRKTADRAESISQYGTATAPAFAVAEL